MTVNVARLKRSKAATPTGSSPHISRHREVAANNRRGWSFVSPTMILILIFFIAPLVLVGVMSVSKWTLIKGNGGMNFPKNFANVFQDPLLVQSVIFTLKYTVLTTVILMPIALLLGMLVQESTRWNNILRTAILLPSALGLASTSLLFYALYSPQVGPLGPVLEFFGFPSGTSILGTPNSALWATVFLVVWRYSGYYMLLNMVGLQAIPSELYEAAKIDGASAWQQFTSVTLPLLRPTIAMTMIMSITGSLLAFDQFFILTKGGPNNSTVTVVQLIYKYAFETKKDLGMAAALSVLVLLALVVVNFFQLKAMGVNRDED